MSGFNLSESIWSELFDIMRNYPKALFPINETPIEILKNVFSQEQAKFLMIFKTNKSYLTFDQLKRRTDLDDDALEKRLTELMYIGAIYKKKRGNQNKITYRLNPLGELMNRRLLRGGSSEKEKHLANLYTKYFGEIREEVQKNYNNLVSIFKTLPTSTKIVPVEKEIEVPSQVVLPHEEILMIIDKFDIIGVGHCYCRQRKTLIGEPCKLGNFEPICMAFGIFAEFLIEHDFIKPVSKEKAIEILKKAEEVGLVHFVFMIPDDPEYSEYGICSCCKCCCGAFYGNIKGTALINTFTSYLAKINNQKCLGTGICAEKCPTEAITLVDSLATINEERCIGCGLCVYSCPEKSIILRQTDLRKVIIPPRRFLEL
ncbi:MAG: DUF362 domain-containing protein [Candidatus Thorarchaeota archaeon]